MGLGDDELHELENILLENPRKGVVIEGLAGIRKLRIRLEGRGKSGGGRVIYMALHVFLGDLYFTDGMEMY